MLETIPADWRTVLETAPNDPSAARLETYVAGERQHHDVYPLPDDVFAALRLTPLASVRAVVLGQDPYHGPDQATGLAFSVRSGSPIPPSLRNILKVLEADLGQPMPRDGSLEPWARNGVLLLNSVLTVRARQPGSHAHQGWEALTKAMLGAVATNPAPVVFLLWGGKAIRSVHGLDLGRHLVFESTHPSPRSFSRQAGGTIPFGRSAPFQSVNAALAQRGLAPIRWDLNPE